MRDQNADIVISNDMVGRRATGRDERSSGRRKEPWKKITTLYRCSDAKKNRCSDATIT